MNARLYDCPRKGPRQLNAFSPLLVGVGRLADTNGSAWLAGVLVSMWSAAIGDLFIPLFALCVAASVLDYHWGKAVALEMERRKRIALGVEHLPPEQSVYLPALATLGWQSKMVGLCVLLLARGFEWWALSNSIDGSVPGLLSVIVAVVYLRHEMDSMDRAARRIGKTIPGISPFLALLSRVIAAITPRGLETITSDTSDD